MKRSGAGTYTVVTDNSSNWNTAYGWGNHASAGYASGTNESNWNTAYGWGNHASAGYLTSLGTAILDGDFPASNGFMKRTGAGTYTVDTNTYVTTSSLTTEGSWTPEFEGATSA